MDAWRGVVVVCSLLVGCGGPSVGGNQGNEPSQDSTPTGGTQTPPSNTDTPPSGGGTGERTTPDPGTGGSTDPNPGTGGSTDPGTGTGGSADPSPGQTRPTLGTAKRVKSFFPVTSAPARLEPAPDSLVAFRNKLYFAVNDEDGHSALWTSDTSTAGTVAVKSFPPVSDPYNGVRQLTPVGTQLFFVADDTTHGSELWVSNGTSSGTQLVKDVTPGPDSSSPSGLVALGQSVLFFRIVSETSTGPVHCELWKSDGSASGTVLLKNLGADSSPGSQNLVVGSTFYFTLSDPAHGSELWKSDGTSSGTQLVRDLVPGADGSYPRDLRAVGQDVYFLASAGAHSSLWKSNGSASGTVLVDDFTQEASDAYVTLLEPLGSTLYLAVSDDDQLMRLYGEHVGGSGPAQRQLVATLPNSYAQPGTDALPIISTSTAAGSKLFFGYYISSSGPAPRDVQLWVTDGTGSGTRQLVRPLSLSDEFTSEIYAVDDQVLTAAITDDTGLEPWVSDGTAAGTRLVQDLQPGTEGSYPRSFLRVGNAVYFVAFDSAHGNSLWVFPPTS